MSRFSRPGEYIPFRRSRMVTRDNVNFIPAFNGEMSPANLGEVDNYQYPVTGTPIAVPGKVVNQTVETSTQLFQNNVVPITTPQAGQYDSSVQPNPNVTPESPQPFSHVLEPARYCDGQNNTFVIGLTPQLILQRSGGIRAFLFMLNTDLNATGGTIWIGFGSAANQQNGIPLIAVTGAFLQDVVVYQNDVWAVANFANVTMMLSYGIKAIS
jgi:hypothetical protein